MKIRRVLGTLTLAVMAAGCGDDGGAGPDSDGSSSGPTTSGTTGVTTTETTTTPGTSTSGSTSTTADPGSSTGDVSEPLPDDAFIDGTRLRARYLDGGDGAVRLLEWVDTELDADCTFAHDASFTVRCIPNEFAFIEYSDAGCTMPIVGRESCQPAVNFVSDTLRPTCPGEIRRREAFEVGATTTPTQLYERQVTGECIAVGEPSPDLTYFSLTRANDDQFIEANLQRYPVGDGLGVIAAEPEDGSFQRLDTYLVDPSFADPGQQCFAQPMGDVTRCIPNTVTYDFGFYFSDAGCTMGDVAYGVAAPECGEPTVSLVYGPAMGACNEREVTPHAAGNEITGQVYFGVDECTPEMSTTQTYFEVGAAFDEADVPLITPVTRGSGSLRVREHGTQSGDNLTVNQAFEDMTADVECDVAPTPEGLRCIPSQRAVVGDFGFWGDDQCSTMQLFDQGVGPCPSDAPVLVTELAPFAACGDEGGLAGIFAVGPQFTGQLYFGTGPMDCTPQDPAPNTEYYEVGTALSWSDYPQVAEVSP